MQADAWAALLSGGDSHQLLDALPAALGFGPPVGADPATRRILGLPEDLDAVRLAAGPGTTRLLLVQAAGDGPGRDHAARIAGRLSKTAPHLLWLLALVVADSAEVVVAAWQAGLRTPRVAALVVDRRQVHQSDAEILSAVRGAMTGPDLLVHARWVEILGREAITRRFFVTLRGVIDRLAEGAGGRADRAVKREVALLHVSRLLFLAFLEERGWLDGDRRFIARVFEECLEGSGPASFRFQQRVLEPLFFGTLNTPTSQRAPRAVALGRIPFLNGGLFARSATERRARDVLLRDEDWGQALDGLFLRYRFTGHEAGSEWQEAAIDPEVLGRAFESLMASAERRTTGVYYTPFALVERVTDAALRTALATRGVEEPVLARCTEGALLSPDEAGRLRAALSGLRVLDPACGSGAFLVHVLDRLTRLRMAAGDIRTPSVIRRDVVSQAVFGVDINPTAVWLCELRLWLALVVDHPAADASAVPPLPNLDHNIRCGDTLAGGDLTHAPGTNVTRAAVLRARYARATGTRKQSLARNLDRAERAGMLAWLDARLAQIAARRWALVSVARGRDLFGGRRGPVAAERDALGHLRAVARELRAQRRRIATGGALPFAFAAHFPDAVRAGGFDVVIGNPPWIRLHHIPAVTRERWRREFRVFREAAWVPGARAARAGSGFGSQVDAASLFIERGHQLLREGGALALVVPSKLWRSLAGGGVRRLITERARLHVLEDLSGAPAMFDAATYPSIVVASSGPSQPEGDVELAVHRGRLNVAWHAPRRALALDDSAGAPWLLLPPEARAAFDRLTQSGVPLAESGLGVAALGVKCGFNDAFLVRATNRDGAVEVTHGGRVAMLDRASVRPVLRGEAVRAWQMGDRDQSIVFPCTPDGRVLSTLPADIRAWLLPWRRQLEARTDSRGERAWWSLFRLEGARYDRPRVVWADLGKSLQALVLAAGNRTVPLNTCYVLPVRDDIDAFAVAALLNSPLADAWVGAVAEPARGGYRRHFAWTMARQPVPDDWARAREILAPLGERGTAGSPPGRGELLAATLDAFRLRMRTVAPLIEWMNS